MATIEITPMMYATIFSVLVVVLAAICRKGDVSAQFKWWGGGFTFEAKEKQPPLGPVVTKSLKR
jgi:hypothetical protein